jgi:type IV secretory pathway VirJ component
MRPATAAAALGLILILALALALASPARAGASTERLGAPGFGKVTIYAPSGTPDQVVLFVSGDGGWHRGVIPMAEHLRDLGALVVGIDIRSLFESLNAAKGCAYPAGSLEELARNVELRHHFPTYRQPILVGYSSGATLVYAALAAAPPEAFAGAISLGFCPDLDIHRPPCREGGLTFEKRRRKVGYDLHPSSTLQDPWMVLQGEIDQVCDPATTRAFVSATGSARLFSLPKVGHGFGVPRNWEPQLIEAYRAIVADHPAAPARRPPASGSAVSVDDLDLVEVPATGTARVKVPATGTAGRDELAVILSGDGGWAHIDKTIAADLAAAGVPVVGWSSLEYYWTPRTPDQAARDLARIIDHYTAAWKKDKVLLVGYSFGADTLPFLVNRLPAPVRARVRKVALLSPSTTADFEFHVTSWVGAGGSSHATAPEIHRMTVPVTCIYGKEDTDSVCLTAKSARLSREPLGGAHHFGGDYGRLAGLILDPPTER